MMLLTRATELVVADTRENTDSNMTISQCITLIRETGEDAAYGTSGELRTAYEMILHATDAQIDHLINLMK